MSGASPGFWISADWPAPVQVRAGCTTRVGGASAAPWDSLNLGAHVGDAPDAVRENRARLQQGLALPAVPAWLNQVHGTTVVDGAAGETAAEGPGADGAFAAQPGVVCAVLTADCLPVLLCDRAGTRVAAAHAGWRGLAAGVLEAALQALGGDPGQVMAWLGPAIGPAAYEVGDEVREAFVDGDARNAPAFVPARPGHWYADLYALARLRLRAAGVQAVYGGTRCTFSEPARFFSYRRDGVTGRMASLIWLDADRA